MRITLLTTLTACVVAFATSAGAASAEATGKLDATVTVASPCLLLDRTTIDFGPLGFSTPGTPTNGTQAAQLTNCGGQAENIGAEGTDSVDSISMTGWRLTSNAGTERNPCDVGTAGQYFLWSALDGYVNPNATSSLVKTGYTVIANSVPASATPTLKATVTMPCTGIPVGVQPIHFSFIYTALF